MVKVNVCYSVWTEILNLFSKLCRFFYRNWIKVGDEQTLKSIDGPCKCWKGISSTSFLSHNLQHSIMFSHDFQILKWFFLIYKHSFFNRFFSSLFFYLFNNFIGNKIMTHKLLITTTTLSKIGQYVVDKNA